jgi:hypothetical protein
MNASTSLILSALGATVILLSQCSPYMPSTQIYGGGTQYLFGYGPPPSSISPVQKPAAYQPQGYWDGDGVTGSSKIRIVRHEQKAYFYKGGTLVGIAPISSGDLDHSTPRGNYSVTEKDIDHESSVYGVIQNRSTGAVVNNNADVRKDKPRSGEVFVHAPMPNFMRFNHGIGMHTGYLPGYAASHGCVRLPDYMASKFYENSKVGTPVIVE